MVVLPWVASCAGGATLGIRDGVNLQPSYFNEGDVDLGWTLMKRQSRIRTVRIEIEPTMEIPVAQRWIREAHEHGYKVIATYHRFEANGSDDPAELMAAARWWRAHYATLSASGPVTVNLMNEWGSHDLKPEAFASAYNAALAVLREVYQGPVILDVPGWGQEIYVACEASRLLPDTNVILSVHIYSSAWVTYGAGHWMTNADLDALAACGRPVIVGEFGALREGGANWSTLIDRAKHHRWTLIAWAWNGDGEGMNMIAPTWEQQPKPKAFTKSPYFKSVYRKLAFGW